MWRAMTKLSSSIRREGEPRTGGAASAALSAHKFDVAKARADFPILQTKSHGKPLVYLDNGATTQKPAAAPRRRRARPRPVPAAIRSQRTALSWLATSVIRRSCGRPCRPAM